MKSVEKRFAGRDRYETSKIIGQNLYSQAKKIYLAGGEIYADGLAIDTFATKQKSSSLFTEKKGIAKKILDYINTLK